MHSLQGREEPAHLGQAAAAVFRENPAGKCQPSSTCKLGIVLKSTFSSSGSLAAADWRQHGAKGLLLAESGVILI